jgi:hypothetical protein
MIPVSSVISLFSRYSSVSALRQFLVDEIGRDGSAEIGPREQHRNNFLPGAINVTSAAFQGIEEDPVDCGNRGFLLGILQVLFLPCVCSGMTVRRLPDEHLGAHGDDGLGKFAAKRGGERINIRAIVESVAAGDGN